MDKIVGEWHPTNRDTGLWFMFGEVIVFKEDSTGSYFSWHHTTVNGHNSEEKFEWKRVKENTIAIRLLDSEPEWDIVEYDFFESEIGTSYWMQMWQTNRDDDDKDCDMGDDFFWRVYDSVSKTEK